MLNRLLEIAAVILPSMGFGYLLCLYFIGGKLERRAITAEHDRDAAMARCNILLHLRNVSDEDLIRHVADTGSADEPPSVGS